MTWQAKPKKWLEAERFTTMAALWHALNNDEVVFWRGKAFGTAVLRNWSIAMINGGLTAGLFARAERNPEWQGKGPTRGELMAEIYDAMTGFEVFVVEAQAEAIVQRLEELKVWRDPK